MAQLAEMTASAGGKALAPEELPTLLAALAAEPPKLHEEVVAKTTYWDTWPFFLAFVALLGHGVVSAETLGIGLSGPKSNADPTSCEPYVGRETESRRRAIAHFFQRQCRAKRFGK